MQLAKSLYELNEAMSNCYQFESMNMLDHGNAVHAAYLELINQLEGGTKIIDLPPQIVDIYNRTKHQLKDLKQYHVYHDCGKHLTRIVDENGRQHFPDHAIYSCRQYLEIWPDDYETATLICMDMDFHTMKGCDLIELWKHPLAPSLYFTAWAEIIANCKMFGGQESTSFKIKKKQLISAAKKYGS